MSMIRVQNLSFTYEGSSAPVFENVSFCIDTDWKLGFTGRNGRGKTTFLQLLTGKYAYTGKIDASVRFTYFPFAVFRTERCAQDVLQDVCPQAEDWQILRELSCLQVDAQALYRPFAALSNGEQTKMLLAALFLNDNDFLLIDEPTNHLDADARAVVSRYLQSKKGFILVSHDRAFLDGCVDHILTINKTDIEIQSGNFSSWLLNYEKRQSFEAAQNDRLQKDIDRLNESAKRTSRWSEKTEASKYGKADSGLKKDKGYVGHKAAKLMKSAKATQLRRQKAIEQKSDLLRNTETSERLKMFPLAYRGDRLLSFANAAILYDDRTVCPPVSFTLSQGERIALCGKNGCGKSSFLRLVAGEPVRHTGDFRLASGLIISYVPQTAVAFDGDLSDFARAHRLDESLFKAILHKMDFSKKDFDGKIASFSQGQQKKVLLAKSLCERAHLYIWDEPLNYIDVFSRLQIENLLREFQPAMLFTEHDKAFLDAVATRVVPL